jgi:ubiquitin-protein ligase
MSNIFVKRLVSDIKALTKNPIDNIFYEHDESNMLKGYAMIIGPEDTPYAYGYYFFEFNFSENYPFEPPIVKYFTNDGKTRFNPNFYLSGKVCLSILNTWRGESWSSCQTISSILLTLMMTLNDNPLLNEPGFTETHKDVVGYKDMIFYKNIEVAILGMLQRKYLSSSFEMFYERMQKLFNQNRGSIEGLFEKISNKRERIMIDTYSSSYVTDVVQLRLAFSNVCKMIDNESDDGNTNVNDELNEVENKTSNVKNKKNVKDK